MSAKDNIVFSTVLQFGRNLFEQSPESIIYGFAKLLTMDEASIKMLIPEQNQKELEEARDFLINVAGLDLELIKSGMPFLSNAVQEHDKDGKNAEFSKFLEGDVDSVAILKKSLEDASMPVKDLFSAGNTMDSIYTYSDKSAKVRKEMPKEPEQKNGDSKKQGPKEESGPKTKETKGYEEPKDLVRLSEEYRNLSSMLMDVIKGQDHAILKFVRGFFQGELLKNQDAGRKGPRSHFFLFGPPGTGKTLLAETAAKAIGRPWSLFDMSLYSNESAKDDLVGLPPVYRDAKEGRLVKFVRENPESLIIFDEIESAHPSVLKLIHQILGMGSLYNNMRNEMTSFADTVIIFTSNVGRDLYSEKGTNLSLIPDSVLLSAIETEKNPYGGPILPVSLCSRIATGNMILFNHLSTRNLSKMIDGNFKSITGDIQKTYGCTVSYDSTLPLLFLYSLGNEIDGRIAANQSGNFIKKEMYEFVRQLDNRRTKEGEIKKICFEVDRKHISPDIEHLFVSKDKSNILVFASKKTQDCFGADEVKYIVYRATTLKKAKELIKHEVSAVFIDPYIGKHGSEKDTLSIADYDTDGVEFFHMIAEMFPELPIFLLNVDSKFTEVDYSTFITEGAVDIVDITADRSESFGRYFDQLMENLYMERESQEFSQQGWVVDFKTKQIMKEDGEVGIVFYDLKKRRAVDVESRASMLSDAERPKERFADVIGAEDAKEELRYFITYLKNPKEFLFSGGKPPKGVLLYGPPGTGKTMLAKAMAGESDVTFIQANATDFANKWVGESEANVRRLFEKARKYAPSIVFIDEIDAIGKQRTGEDPHTESILNALLTEMQGFRSGGKPVFVLAATNYGVTESDRGISMLDQALVRRFDNKIYVSLPNEAERKKYIKMILESREAEIGEDVIDNLAKRTPGQSLAIVQNIIELAFRNANRLGRPIEGNDLLTALEDYNYGQKKSWSEEYYRSVAIHETGHAFVSHLSGVEPVYITIESRSDFGGYMQQDSGENTANYTLDDLLARIRTSLAGRAAEYVFYGKAKANNTGASSDLKHASDMAFDILCRFGMEEGQLLVLNREDVMKSSMVDEYTKRANEILTREMKNTIKLIEDNKDKIQEIADVLLEKNHLTGEEFKELVK